MHRQQLTRHEDLVHFQQQFRVHSGIEVPLDYYQNAIVTGVYNSQHELIGGYATARGHAARWPKQIPTTTEFQSRVDLNDTLELNSVWLNPTFRKQSGSARFWLTLGQDMASRKIRYIVFVVDPKKTGLARLYKKAASGTIYEGSFINSSLTTARICFATPLRFRVLPILYAVDLLERFIRGNNNRRPMLSEE